MSESYRDVAVTGIGAVCAVGGDCAAVWEAILAGRDGIEQIRRFSTECFGVHTGAEVKGWDTAQADQRTVAEALCHGFAAAAAHEAWRSAGIGDADVAQERIGFAFGSGLGDGSHPIHLLAEQLADELGCRGPRFSVSTACSSSTGALGLARDLIAMGSADIVVAGGADVLRSEVFAGFHALGVLTSEKCAPFSYPYGTTLGEGAGFAVLERGDLARRRGVERLMTLTGFGLSGDAYHETSPEPRGAGVERAIRLALADAAVSADEIDYVNVHGSGTSANDTSEWQGIQRGLGAHAQTIPLSSCKGALGHAQGAAGILETVVTIIARRHGRVPPTLNFAGARPHAPPDPVAGPEPRSRSWSHALSLNSAFGGSNAAVVLSSPSHESKPRVRRPVYVLGTGIVGPWGLGNAAFVDARRNGNARGERVPPFDIERLVPRADPRGLDPLSRFLIAACKLALDDAGLRVRGRLRNRTGLFVGTARPSTTSVAEFVRSIEERGLIGLSASAFARVVLNAASGFASKQLGLRGPLTTVTTGEGSGLAAVVHSAELIGTQGDVDMILAGGVDEHVPAGNPDGGGRREGAACLLLGGDARVSNGARSVRITGWGLAGPGRLADAVEQATAMDEQGGSPRFRSYSARDWGIGAVDSALACAQAVLVLRSGEVDDALVVSDGGGSVSIALLLSARGS